MTSDSITLQAGHPSDVTGRPEAELRCYDVLDSLGIEYLRADHPHADTIEECLEIEKALGNPICKNLFLTNRNKTDFYLLLMPGNKPFKTKYLCRQMDCPRLSFAGPESMQKLLGLAPGSVSVLGLINDTECVVRLIMDKDVFESEYICCHPCKNTSTLKIKTADILEKLVPYVKHTVTVVDLPTEEIE